MAKADNNKKEIKILFKDYIDRGKACRLLDSFGLVGFPRWQPWKNRNGGLTTLIVCVPAYAAGDWVKRLQQKEEVASAKELATS